MTDLSILACQPSIPPTPDAAARDTHLAAFAERIRNLVGRDRYDLIVLPELSSIEYSDAAFDVIEGLAEPLNGPSLQVYAALAQDLGSTVVYGFPRRATSGAIHICQAVVDPSGSLLGHYDKLHLAQFGASAEAKAFAPGNHLFAFSIKGLRIAPVICYDIRFPDLAQRLADAGTDLILQCSAFSRDLSFHSWRSFVVTRAMEHGTAWLGLNRAGAGWGGSVWCPGFAGQRAPRNHLWQSRRVSHTDASSGLSPDKC